MKPTLTEQDYQDAARALNCDVPALKAVCNVESAGRGFNANESVKILYEGHLFHRLTGGRYSATHPTLSYPKWTKQFYGRDQSAEWARLLAAMELDKVAAIMSTSWGMFQVLGSNHAACGFKDAADMVKAYATGEPAQLKGFVEFVKFSGIDDELREHRWADFAKRYNGPAYLTNGYHTKMAAAYARFSAA